MNGLLNIYKEQDFTSMDVVAKLRGICHQKKIGHTGTLDPMATGVLPVCLGSATKLCDMLTDHDKVYETVLLLGKTSDTQDVWGEILGESYVNLSEDEIIEAVKSFEGEYDQIPPMYSAKKIGGQKLYDLARAGVTVERKPVRVQIFGIEITRIDLPRVHMRIHCGKGTYIRTLCNDIGEKLGCGGIMEELRRTRVGTFEIENAYTLAEVEAFMKDGLLPEKITPIEKVFEDLEAVILPKEQDRFLYNGNPLIPERCGLCFTKDNVSYQKEDNASLAELKYRIYDSQNVMRAIYRYDNKKKLLMPDKMFLEN